MRLKVRRLAGAVALGMMLVCAACTLLLDRNSVQCQTDGDCARFGSHPYCNNGLCVASGLSPKDCFYGTPQRPKDFLNQCSAVQCLSFDNCSRLGLCGGASNINATLAPPPPATSTASTPPVIASDAGASGDGGPSGEGGASTDGGAPTQLPSCQDATAGRSQVVYITGSSNFPPLLAKLAPLILTTGYTPVFQITNSCTGVKSIFSAQPADQVISDPSTPNGKYAAYYGTDGKAKPCSLGPSGARVDVGESDVFSSTCDGFGAPEKGLGEYLGPIQAMAFVVPGKSTQTAITAEAARAVFGLGGVAPWTNPSMFFVRNAGTGTQQMIGHAIAVPANAFWGVDRGTASQVDALMRVISDDTLAQQAIGIISDDYYDNDRVNLKALAFKAAGQECAYLPDSTEFKKDKRNVRDGHYPIWGPVHFFTAISNGVPSSPGAQAFVSVVSVPNVQQSLLDAFIASSMVPGCAMSVQRSSELGPLSAYSAPFQCSCYFEASPSVNGAAPPECQRCSSPNDCTDPRRPACNLGYCELQ
jgi:ABC-type phosphate transport system substrate-binding protein